MKQYAWVQDNFSKSAVALRKEFDNKFADPKRTHPERFVWDYWNVPGQYTHLRTPAEHFFPQRAFAPFLKDLGEWARVTLGCTAITPPWLSYYVEGCEQQFHSDVPHGPWAFVFSLTPAKRKFRGGETVLFRPEVLDYWKNFADSRDRELNSFLEKIEPRFNRLVVFDPRIPHGVSRVEGTMDPREARLVIHGWFTDPKPCIDGPLTARQIAPVLDDAVGRFSEELSSYGLWHGVLSLRIHANAAGRILKVEILADTLVPLQGDPESALRIRAHAKKRFAEISFPRSRAASKITLPLLFRT